MLGGGPAGLAAALYAARAGLKPVLIAPVVGGQLQGKGVDVENFPGVPGGSGVEIVRTMRAQCAAFGARGVDDLASAVDLSARPFRVTLNATADVVHARAIIVATGADARWLGAPGEYEYRGRGVSSCATCDGFAYAGKRVLVIGGGDAAMEDALYLARTAKSVVVVHRRGALRASHALASRVLAHKAVTGYHAQVVGFGGDAAPTARCAPAATPSAAAASRPRRRSLWTLRSSRSVTSRTRRSSRACSSGTAAATSPRAAAARTPRSTASSPPATLPTRCTARQ